MADSEKAILKTAVTDTGFLSIILDTSREQAGIELKI
jgi:hypothetical protein